MNRLTRPIEQNLKEIAAVLPDAEYGYKDVITMTGEDAKKSGMKDTEHLEDDKEYPVTTISFNQVNHFRRIKTAFRNGGWDGVDQYLRKYNFTLKKKSA